MAALLRSGRPAAIVMGILNATDRTTRPDSVARNGP